jgi:L-alanine-DL-glutamate epimerase-like enolase superfamily enzyme
MDAVIRRLDWGLARVPLKQPYHLSFASLEDYATIWVRFESMDGSVGLGEAVPLPGYGDETIEEVRKTVAALTERAEGKPVSEIAGRCREIWPDRPFAASSVMTALELPELIEETQTGAAFPLNFPVAGDAPESLLQAQIESALDQGFRFIKVKCGKNLTQELANLPLLLSGFQGRTFKALFDANQGFSRNEALAFAQGLKQHDKGRLCWFEQPLDRRDWEGLARLCAASPVPIILDESVYSALDIRRAAEIGAHGVKLKLFKQGGPFACLALARQAKDLGLTVVFGNGVATDIGNLAEYLIAAQSGGLFSPPMESNGFSKLTRPLLGTSLTVKNGSLILTESPQDLRRSIHAFQAGNA